MHIFKILFAAVLCALTIMACEPDESEKPVTESTPNTQEETQTEQVPAVETTNTDWQQSLCSPEAWKAWLGQEPLEASHPLMQQYGKVCKAIYEIEGISFNGLQHPHLCMIEVIYEGEGVSEAEVKQTFGDHIMLGDMLKKRGMVYTSFGVILDGEKVITHAADFQQYIASVNIDKGAAALAYLTGALGEGYQPGALCKASISQTSEGWTMERADVFVNCKPREWRTLTVSTQGVVAITQTEEQKNPDGTVTAICVD